MLVGSIGVLCVYNKKVFKFLIWIKALRGILKIIVIQKIYVGILSKAFMIY